MGQYYTTLLYPAGENTDSKYMTGSTTDLCSDTTGIQGGANEMEPIEVTSGSSVTVTLNATYMK